MKEKTGVSPTMINLDTSLKERLREFVDRSQEFRSMTQVVITALLNFLDKEEKHGK